jgi:hypothetical protein
VAHGAAVIGITQAKHRTGRIDRTEIYVIAVDCKSIADCKDKKIKDGTLNKHYE